MLLVLIAVAMCTIMALSFLAAQEPTAAVASNIDRKTQARAIAESALKMAIDYVNEDADWRSDKSSGTWIANAALDGGTFTLSGIDEDDGDLTDDVREAVILTVVATYQGVTHRVSARVTPGADESSTNRLLLVAGNGNSPSSTDRAKRDLFESWGYMVTVIDDSASQASYDAAVAVNDVVFVSEEVNSGSVNTKLRDITIGVVNGDAYLHDDFGFSSSNSRRRVSTDSLDIVDNTHPITAGYATGELEFHVGSINVFYMTRSIASGVTVLADRSGRHASAIFAVADVGDQLRYGPAAARRVMFPATDDLNVNNLSSDGQALLQRSIAWAAGGGARGDDSSPTLLALYEFDEQPVADPTLIGHWRLDEVAAGGAGGVSGGQGIEINDSARIDSYNSAAGSYASQTSGAEAVVTVNSTGEDDFTIDGSGYLGGDAYIGPGGSISSVFDVDRGATLTGSKQLLSQTIPITWLTAPSAMPSDSGHFRISGSTSITIDSDRTYKKLELEDSAIVTIDGDVTIWIKDKLKLENNAQVIIPPGSSLTLYTAKDFDVKDSAQLNGDSTATNRLTVYAYSSNKEVHLQGSAVMAATLYTNDALCMKDSSHFFGKVLAYDAVDLEGSAELHQDLSLGGFGAGGGGGAMPDAEDASSNGHAGTYHGDAAGGQTGFGDGGTAVQFDGDGDYVEIAHDASFLLDRGSVGLHFYADRLGGQQALFSKDSSGNDNGGHVHLYADGNRLKARIQTTSDDPYRTGSSVEVESSGSALSDRTWHHALVTWGDGQLRLYLDGVLVDAADHLGGLGTTSGGAGNDEPIVIGAGTTSSGDQSARPVNDEFTGRIDDVRIYDMPLDRGQAINLAGGYGPGVRTAPGYVIADVSGYDSPLDLLVYDTNAITWLAGGGLQFTGDTLATSQSDAAKLHDAIEATEAFAVELIIQRATPGHTASPSRIVSYSDGPTDHNFMFGQDGTKYEARVRDSATGFNGALSPEFVSSTNLTTSADIHLVLSYQDGNASVYINGVLDKTATAGGTLNNWNAEHFLVLAGAYTGGSHWQGTIKRLAIYDNAFNATQAQNVFIGEPPGTGQSGSAGTGSVQWDELD